MSALVEAIIILLLLLINGFFALAEISIVSSRKSRLQRMANEGDRHAKIALDLANAPTTFLSSVQLGITLVGILAGAFGGATLSADLARVVRHIPGLARYAPTISFVAIVLIITYLTIIIGELAPKRIALINPERYARLVARPMSIISTIVSPLVAFLGASSDLLIKIFRIPAKAEPPVSDEEIRMLFEEGISAGVFERTEKDIVDRLFRLSDRRVNSIMTTRPDIVWLEVGEPQDEIVQTITTHDFTAYPVYEEDIDNIIGVVFAKDIVGRLLRNEMITLAEMVRKPLIFHESFHALRAIESLKQSGTHIAIVIDEYGTAQGILTLTDIFESLVGEIPSFEEPDIVRRDDGSLLIDGFLAIDELKSALQVPSLPYEEQGNYQTLAGFIMTYLGRVPKVGDHFTWNHFCFEVVDMDANRIDRVLITKKS
ncbi:MAG TPA: hemolysin family protein [Armatimonadota bacterium]|nr:hemolysin family protein [Armatimonadota bacterium]